LYLKRVPQLNQAIFYCYDESFKRFAVSRVAGFTIKDDNTVQFEANNFPLIENAWNVFAAELHFFKKGLPFSMILHGTAVIEYNEQMPVEFNIQNAEYFDHPLRTGSGLLTSLFKPYIYFYRKGSELFSHSFKRKDEEVAFNKISTNL
jgi:hypothetical protein